MRPVRWFVLVLLPCAAPAFASGPLLFQYGGRGTAEVGAFTARATGAGAISYNPAAVARLRGAYYQLGSTFTAPRDTYRSASGRFEQDKLITEAPLLYASWHLPDDYYPVAFGIAVENRAWYLADWAPKLFPGRFLTTRQQLTIWSLHPVVAYELGDRWSVGAGARYNRADLEEGNNQVFTIAGQAQAHAVEVERVASATADGYSFDVGLHYGADSWGWGLAFDTGGKVEGNGDVTYEARNLPEDPVLRANVASTFERGGTRQRFDLPWEARSGLWVAPYPELRLELDLAWTAWSKVDETSTAYQPDPFGTATSGTILAPGSPGRDLTEVRRRDWEDTLSIRLGIEQDVGEHWLLAGGIALEPSPVPNRTVEPGFARGDAVVYGLGFAYRVNRVTFDLGYSYYQYDRRTVGGQEQQLPALKSSYRTKDQVFGFSASWHR